METYKIFLYGAAAVQTAFWLHEILIKDKQEKKEEPKKKVIFNYDLSALITACLGDKAKAMRLADYEQKLNSGLSRKEAIKYAIERLERDRS